jgi:WD40 repeat protein
MLQVWTASMDGRLYVYRDDGVGGLVDVQALTHESMRSGVRVLAQLGDRIFAGAEDGHIACWKEDSRLLVAALSVHSNIVSCLCCVGDQVCSATAQSSVLFMKHA